MKPFVILINGLLMYQPGGLTPLAPLASQLEANGWEVCIDNHFNTKCYHPRPDLIIGHSQGGATALRLANERKPKLVITFDAVRMQACPTHLGVRCINFRTPAYPSVPRGENISVLAEHATMVYLPSLKQKVLAYAKEARRVDNDPPIARMAIPQRNQQAERPRRSPDPQLSVRRGDSEAFHRGQNLRPPEDTILIERRWPNTSFGELKLPLEEQCALLSSPNPEVCP